MNNPWLVISAQSIHPDDESFAARHNRSAAKKSAAQQIRAILPPQPYVGDPRTARVVLLGKNASFGEQDEQDALGNPAIEDESRKSLTFESDYPFFSLDPRFAGTAGYRWWQSVLTPLLQACRANAVEEKTVLSRIACAQYHPYRSEKSFVPVEPFPTQQYTFHLVSEATRRPDCLFVMLYGAANERLWRQAVPELPADCLRTKSAQNAILSPGSVSADGWERLVTRLCAPE